MVVSPVTSFRTCDKLKPIPGLLCVTCTDLAVLAGSNYPEKAYVHSSLSAWIPLNWLIDRFSNYGGASVNAEYQHEVALRLVLNSLATTAAKYGRQIIPLLSLSIDFYVRLFVRVESKPEKVKALARWVIPSCLLLHFEGFHGATLILDIVKPGSYMFVHTVNHLPHNPSVELSKKEHRGMVSY